MAVAAFAASAQTMRWGRDYFPNVELQDHNGRALRFYDDIIRGKVVAINFIYTTCTDVCPLDTAQLRQVQQILGDRVGRDVPVLLNLKPAGAHFMEDFHAGGSLPPREPWASMPNTGTW